MYGTPEHPPKQRKCSGATQHPPDTHPSPIWLGYKSLDGLFIRRLIVDFTLIFVFCCIFIFSTERSSFLNFDPYSNFSDIQLEVSQNVFHHFGTKL
jgi:hypothetical protein